MEVAPNHDADEGASGEGSVRTSGDGIHLRKSASMFTDDAVAVDLTIRSDRTDPCLVEVTDVLPEAVRENHVEFHPHYDPDHWSREGDRVVYRAPIGPGVVRRTVYGVNVDEAGQMATFSDVPTIAVEAVPEDSDAAFQVDTVDPNDRDGSGSQPTADIDDTSSTSSSRPATATGADETTDPFADAVPPDGDVVAAFVDEVRRRELTGSERTALRRALGLDDDGDSREELAESLEALETDLEALREEVASIERPADAFGGIEERLEALSTELESTADALSADLEDLRADLEQEVRWRSQLRETVTLDPDEA